MTLDNLGQSGPIAPLPDDLQARVENAQNTVTLLDAEATRLQKLLIGQRDEVNKLHEEKVGLEKSVFKLTTDITACIDDLANKRSELNTIKDMIVESKKVLLATEKSVQEQRTEIVKECAALDLRNSNLNDKEEEITKRDKTLLDKEMAYEAKVAKLKAAIE